MAEVPECPHDEFTLEAEVVSGYTAKTVKVRLECKLCGAPFEWLPFLAVENVTGDLLLSARCVGHPAPLVVHTGE